MEYMKRKTIWTVVFVLLVAASILAGCEDVSDTSSASESTQSAESLAVTSSEDIVLESSETESESSAEASSEESSLPQDDSSDEMIDDSSDETETSDESVAESSEEESSEAETSSAPDDPYRTGVVTYDAPSLEETYTRLPSLEQLTYYVPDADNERNLDTTKKDFGFGVAKDGKAHAITVDNQKRFDSYGTNALAWDNKSGEKVLYLTFDCGYQYKDAVERILDTLAEKDVPAAFFGTLHYIKTAPHEVARMIQEGHIVGNHTVNHPSNSAALTREKLASEILGVENYLREQFGYTSKYFRFPGGVHSENAVDLVHSIGYRAVFWSLAHTDWDPENQPGVEKSFAAITGRLHDGAVILLHATSPDNVAILADYIDYCRAQGYTFRSLDEYPYWIE